MPGFIPICYRLGWIQFLLLTFGLVNAQASLYSESSSGLLKFRISQLSMFTRDQGNSFSAMPSWNPSLELIPELTLVLGLGFTLLKNTSSSNLSVIEITSGVRGLIFDDFALQGDLGVQSWSSSIGIVPIAGVLGIMPLEIWEFQMLKEVFVGYSHVFMGSRPTHEIKVGVGFGF